MSTWANVLWKVFNEAHSSFKAATPFRKFEMLRNFTDSVLRTHGVHVLGECESTWRTAMAPIAVAQFLLFAFYTTYYYWNENKITAIQPYTVVAIVSVSIYFHILSF